MYKWFEWSEMPDILKIFKDACRGPRVMVCLRSAQALSRPKVRTPVPPRVEPLEEFQAGDGANFRQISGRWGWFFWPPSCRRTLKYTEYGTWLIYIEGFGTWAYLEIVICKPCADLRNSRFQGLAWLSAELRAVDSWSAIPICTEFLFDLII